MDLGIAGRRALVAGGSRGIGYACAQRLAEAGVDLAIIGRDRSALDDAVGSLRASGRVIPIVADLASANGPSAAYEEAAGELGGIDILVNNGGGPKAGPFSELSDEDWKNAFELVLMNTVRLTRAAVAGMAERRWGRVVNVMSTSVKQPVENLMLSNSIRMAVVGLMKTLTTEYSGVGVTFNTVAPGFTRTERLESLAASQAERKRVDKAEVFDGWAADVPLRRIGEPEEVAAAVAFLASEPAAYINGVVLPVDGGRVRASL